MIPSRFQKQQLQIWNPARWHLVYPRGDQLTVEQSLYGLLLKSANEIGNGLAEHVSGSVSAFADLMNAKAKELGCKNTHFCESAWLK